MLAVAIKWDDQFSPLLQRLSDRDLKNAIRRSVDKSARAARQTTIPVIASDMGVGPGKISKAVPTVKASTQSNLSATWTVKKLAVGILNVSGASISKTGGLTASTHRLTGGGSSSLRVKNAFKVKGKWVAVRKGKSRLPIKAIYAEHPATSLGQPGSAAGKFWQAQAEMNLANTLPHELQKALGGAS